MYFFYYAEFQFSGSDKICYEDAILKLPSDVELSKIDQYVRDHIKERCPNIVKSTIRIKSL